MQEKWAPAEKPNDPKIAFAHIYQTTVPYEGSDMLRSFRMGKAFGIPLYVHSTFLLLPLYALFLGRHDGPAGILFGQLVLLSLFGCVMLHELGHALMARYFGIGTRDITLYPIGGVARLESTGNRPHEELCIALAGPAINLAIVVLLSPLVFLAFVSGLLRSPGEGLVDGGGGMLSILADFVAALWMGNGILLLFNLLPVFPMDGGRVLRALLGMTMDHLRATEVAASIGLFAAGCLALLGLWFSHPSLVLVALFVAFAGQRELAFLRRQEAYRRAERAAEDFFVEPILVEPILAEPVSHSHQEGFTGFLWDRDHRVWVRWVNGRPVGAL
jgi:Zn-dependent protease